VASASWCSEGRPEPTSTRTEPDAEAQPDGRPTGPSDPTGRTGPSGLIDLIGLIDPPGPTGMAISATGQADQVLGPLKGAGWQSTDTLYPIPKTDITADPNLTQNPGY